MSFIDRINNKIFARNIPDGKTVMEEYLFILSKELSVSPGELLSYPIPLVLSLLGNMGKFYEEQKKASKKKR